MDKKTCFIAVRHGRYNGANELSEAGEKQIQELAEKINAENSNGLPVRLICSTAPRAKQGGEILIEKLGIKEVFFARCLWDDSSHYSDWEEVESLINDNLIVGEIIIYMSHLDLVPRIARHVAFKLGHEDGVEWFENSKYAEGWLINSQGTVPFPR